MKFLVVSNEGYGIGIAAHLSSEGHSVCMSLNTPRSDLGAGIVNVSTSADRSADITLFDSDLFGRWADEERTAGKRVLGASHWSEILSKDPEYAQSVIDLAGWPTEITGETTNFWITAWYNGAHYIATYTSFMYNRLMSSGRGPDIAAAGAIGCFTQPTERVQQEILRPLEPILRRTNHRGCCHVHVAANKDSYAVRAINGSFNSPLALLLLENSKSATSDILLRLFDEASKPIPVLEQWSVAILVTVPPYPYAVPASVYMLTGLQNPALKHVWLIDAKKVGSDFMTAGVHGKVGYITARGGYVQEAVKRAYRTLNNLHVEDLQYRDDIGRNVGKLITNLREQQWLR